MTGEFPVSATADSNRWIPAPPPGFEEEILDASRLRTHAGPIYPGGDVGQASESESSPNLEQPASGQSRDPEPQESPEDEIPESPEEPIQLVPPVRRARREGTLAAERQRNALSTLQRAIADAKPCHTGGERVGSKRVHRGTAKKLKRIAAEALAEHFSIFELCRIMQQPGYGLEEFMLTLKEVRDNQDNNPKDRMAAADRILEVATHLITANLPVEDTMRSVVSPAPDPNIRRVLLEVRGQPGLGEPNGAVTVSRNTSGPAGGNPADGG